MHIYLFNKTVTYVDNFYISDDNTKSDIYILKSQIK